MVTHIERCSLFEVRLESALITLISSFRMRCRVLVGFIPEMSVGGINSGQWWNSTRAHKESYRRWYCGKRNLLEAHPGKNKIVLLQYLVEIKTSMFYSI